MQAKLVIIGGDERERQFDLRLPAIVGRSRTTDVTLGHPLVSRHHCELFEAGGRLMVRDLGSLNGTYVGDDRVSDSPVPLQPGQRLTVGSVTLQADYLAAEEPAIEEPASDEHAPGGPTIDSPLEDSADDDHRFDSHHAPRSGSRRLPGSRE